MIIPVLDRVWGMPRAMLGSPGAPGLSVWVRSDAFCDRSGLPPKRRKLCWACFDMVTKNLMVNAKKLTAP